MGKLRGIEKEITIKVKPLRRRLVIMKVKRKAFEKKIVERVLVKEVGELVELVEIEGGLLEVEIRNR